MTKEGLPKSVQILVALLTLFISGMQIVQQRTLDELEQRFKENQLALERQVAQRDFLDGLLTRIETYLNEPHHPQRTERAETGGGPNPGGKDAAALDETGRLRTLIMLAQIAIESHIEDDLLLRGQKSDRGDENGADDGQPVITQHDLLRKIPPRLALLAGDDSLIVALHNGEYRAENVALWADFAAHSRDPQIKETGARALAEVGVASLPDAVALHADLLRRMNDIVAQSSGDSPAIGPTSTEVIKQLRRLRGAVESFDSYERCTRSGSPVDGDNAVTSTTPTGDPCTALIAAIGNAEHWLTSVVATAASREQTATPALSARPPRPSDLSQLDFSDAQQVVGQTVDSLQAAPILPATPAESLLDAAAGAQQEAGQPLDRLQVERLLDALQNGEPAVRRSARSALAAIGPDAVPRMMHALRAPGDIYRTRLGVLVALNEMLPEAPAGKATVGKNITKQLSAEDWTALANSIDVDDRTMRQYATELLYDLDDTMKVEPLLAAAEGTARAETRYQAVFALGSALGKLEEPEQAAAASRLRELCGNPPTGPNTRELIDQRLREADQPGCRNAN